MNGYLLQVNDRALFETLSSGENAAAHFIPSGSEERVRYLLVLLLGQVDYVKLDDVSEELYVSKYTISGDLHQVEEELAKYHLSILRRPNYGIRVTGREIDIRNCTAHVLANYNNMMPDGGAGYRNMAQRISQCLMSAMHKHALHFSEINFRNLVNTIFATIHRALQHAFIPLLEEDSAPDINENVYAAAHYLAELLEAQFDIRLPEPEVLFLALNIAGKCNYSSADREDENVVIAPEIMALVDDMLESIYESFKLDYSTNFLLRMNLGQHLVAMDIRLRYGMPIENPLLCEVHMQYEGANIAEAWMLSCHPSAPSMIENGTYSGKTLQQYLDAEGPQVLGSFGMLFHPFPILIKLIDAAQPLSIQVHPSNFYAINREHQYGKTEMWYVVDAEPGAFLYYGFRQQITREEFARRIEDNTLPEVLNAVPVCKGDCFYIPSGTVHAIGKGILIAEVQQNSDVTYRVYDYDRRDATGKPRQLHTEQAEDVAKRTPPRDDYNFGGHLIRCEYFTVDRMTGSFTDVCDDESFTSLVILDGNGTLIGENEKMPLQKGDSFFLPANSGSYRVEGNTVILKTRVGTI